MGTIHVFLLHYNYSGVCGVCGDPYGRGFPHFARETRANIIILAMMVNGIDNDDGERQQHQEALLRRTVADKPKNARAMAQLACCLFERAVAAAAAAEQRGAHQLQQQQHEQAQGSQGDADGSRTTTCKNKLLQLRPARRQSSQRQQQQQQQKYLLQEALDWAIHSVETAPGKPYGHAALSVIYSSAADFDRRMEALRRAIDCCNINSNINSNNQRYNGVASIGLLVRLLVEPREDEAKRIRAGQAVVIYCTPTKNHKQQQQHTHPNQRPLNKEEEALYKRIEDSLAQLWNNDSFNNNATAMHIPTKEREFVALREYRLGLLFRKLVDANDLPARSTSSTTPDGTTKNSNRERSRAWFAAAASHFPARHGHVDLAHFWLATLTDESTTSSSNVNASSSPATAISKCPAAYVVRLYSSFAARFDDLLVTKLSYQTPTLLRQLLDDCTLLRQQHELLPNNSNKSRRTCYSNAADLGCGTGLSGMAFASCITPATPAINVGGSGGYDGLHSNTSNSIKHNLTGVDLSPEMLAQADKRGCYNRLITGDIVTILTDNNENDEAACQNYDLVFACDVFCYIGDLSDVFVKVHRSLVSEGVFAFSTELLLQSGDAPFRLHECARFAHTQSYIESLAAGLSFDIEATRVCPIRKNQGKDVAGLLVVLRKR